MSNEETQPQPASLDYWFTSGFMPFKAVKRWIEEDLKRTTDSVIDLSIETETIEVTPSPESAWRTWDLGTHRYVEVMFADGYKDGLHLYITGGVCLEPATWRMPDSAWHIGAKKDEGSDAQTLQDHPEP